MHNDLIFIHQTLFLISPTAFSPISSSMTQAGNPSSPNGSSPTGEEMNPIAMAINCMNGEVKQESMHARYFTLNI